jgi:hypothetical protein
MANSVFLDIMSCTPLKFNRRFRGTCRLHLQGRRIGRARNQRVRRWQIEQSACRNLRFPSAAPASSYIAFHRTQAHDFSPTLLGSLPATALPFLPCLSPRPTQTALIRAMLIILFLSAIGSLGCVWQPMGTAGSFCPTGDPTGTDWLAALHSPPVSYIIRNFGKPPAFTLVSCSAYSPTLRIEAICSSKTSVNFQRTTWRYITEDGTLHNHRCENLRWYKTASK